MCRITLVFRGVKMQVSDDFEFWKWVSGAALTVAGGLIGGGWAGRGFLESMRREVIVTQSKVEANILRIDALEARHDAQSAEIRQGVAEIREGVAEIRQGVAVVSALHAETQADVQAIFARLNRRHDDLPHGEERRHG